MSLPSRAAPLAVALVTLLSWCSRPAPAADAQPRAVAEAAPRYVAMLGADARHTGRDARRGPVRAPTILWRVRTQRRIFGSPVLDAADRAVFGSLDGRVLAVDRAGVVRWSFTAPDRVFSSPAVVGALAVFGHDGDRVLAVDARGAERWSAGTPDDADGSPVVGPDETVYFASHEAVALDGEGRPRWRTPLRSHAFGAPALSPDGTLYVPELAGAVSLLRARDGALVRRVEVPAPVYAGVLVLDDGGFVVGALDGHVRAYGLDGALRWDFATRGARDMPGVRAMPALTRDNVVVVGAEDGGIYGLRAADGGEVFRVATSNPVRSSARIDADGRIYVGGEDDTLRCLDGAGAALWSVVLGADIDGTPAILADGTLVVGTDDGALYALGAPLTP
jgi:outer membrane protein assembly factor BamB